MAPALLVQRFDTEPEFRSFARLINGFFVFIGSLGIITGCIFYVPRAETTGDLAGSIFLIIASLLVLGVSIGGGRRMCRTFDWLSRKTRGVL
ncbi:MAG: hypothetical protein WCV85_01240 [Patescibacteria group bacterium]|jgi:hypothetical protein